MKKDKKVKPVSKTKKTTATGKSIGGGGISKPTK